MDKGTDAPQAYPRRSELTVKARILVAAGLAIAAFVVFNAVLALGATAVFAHEVRTIVGSAQENSSQIVERTENRHPGFSRFTADPVWDSPEWAALAAAKQADENALHTEVFAEQRGKIEEQPWPFRGINLGMINDMAPVPVDRSAPLDDATAADVHVLAAFNAGLQACSSGDITGYVAEWDPANATLDTAPGTTTGEAWISVAPDLVRAAASSACGNS